MKYLQLNFKNHINLHSKTWGWLTGYPTAQNTVEGAHSDRRVQEQEKEDGGRVAAYIQYIYINIYIKIIK